MASGSTVTTAVIILFSVCVFFYYYYYFSFVFQYRPLQKCLNFVIAEDSVIVSPREELRRQPVQVNLGEPWNATCKATGNPAPKMEWRKQYSSQTLPTTQHGSKGVVLKIEALAEKDLGIYLCLAENGLGKDNASIELGEL